MSDIEQAIKEAIAAGWLYLGEYRPRKTDRAPGIAQFSDDGFDFLITKEQAFLDPLFWQALGKARGWSNGVMPSGRIVREPTNKQGGMLEPQWKWQWHRFIDRLAQGKTAEEFFADLLPNHTSV